MAASRRARRRKGAGSRSPAPGTAKAGRERSPERRAPVSRAGGERPQAPWGSFPLTELTVLLALVLGVVGFVTWDHRGQVMVLAAVVLGSLAGLELALREHFAGHRSHTTLLAGLVAVFVLGALYVLVPPGDLPAIARLAIAAPAFGVTFWALRRAFVRRSGGAGFR